MKKTLLQITQDILSDMTDDEVNSIDDTFSSQQVAQIVRSTYEAMLSNRNWPHTRRLIQITPFSSQTNPTHMILQERIKELCFINYNVALKGVEKMTFKRIDWVEPDDFLRRLNARDNTRPNIQVVTDVSGVQLLIIDDKHPDFYTSFDDTNLIFDSFHKDVDNTLQESKIQAMAYVDPVWQHIDGFIPDLPAEAFSALIAEAKSSAMMRLKQMQDVKSEQESVRQQRWLSRKAWRAHGGVQYPDYSRRGRR